MTPPFLQLLKLEIWDTLYLSKTFTISSQSIFFSLLWHCPHLCPLFPWAHCCCSWRVSLQSGVLSHSILYTAGRQIFLKKQSGHVTPGWGPFRSFLYPLGLVPIYSPMPIRACKTWTPSSLSLCNLFSSSSTLLAVSQMFCVLSYLQVFAMNLSCFLSWQR